MILNTIIIIMLNVKKTNFSFHSDLTVQYYKVLVFKVI